MPVSLYKAIFKQYDDPACRSLLYTPCEQVTDINSSETKKMLNDLSIRLPAGIGLAANQVGYHKQAFMIRFDSAGNKRYPQVFQDVPQQTFINPKITQASSENVSFWHGCLSAITHSKGKVATWSWIEYDAQDSLGKRQTGRLEGLAAVIFQHEFRHLLGSCFLDHAKEFMDQEVLHKKFEDNVFPPMALCGPEVPHLLSDYQVGESIEEYARRLGL